MHLDWTRGLYKYLFVKSRQDVALLHVATCLHTCVEMPSSEEHVLSREVRSAATALFMSSQTDALRVIYNSRSSTDTDLSIYLPLSLSCGYHLSSSHNNFRVRHN